MLEALEVPAAVPEDPLGQEPAEADGKVDVLGCHRCPVERIPQPQQRLDPGELHRIDVGVVLGLEGDVARVEREERQLLGPGHGRVAHPLGEVGDAGVPERQEQLAGQVVPALRVLQTLVELSEPLLGDEFGGIREADLLEGLQRHADLRSGGPSSPTANGGSASGQAGQSSGRTPVVHRLALSRYCLTALPPYRLTATD